MDKRKIERIATRYGFMNQSIVAMEECGELIQALAKYNRAAYSRAEPEWIKSAERAAVIEEMADVEIMIEQLKLMMRAHDEVADMVDAKIERQIRRMDGESS